MTRGRRWAATGLALLAAGAIVGVAAPREWIARVVHRNGGEPPVSGLFAIVSDGKLGFVDGNGKPRVAPAYAVPAWFDLSQDPFGRGPAPVLVDGRWGFIDRKGTLVVNPQFDGADMFYEGLARVTLSGRVGYIDRGGRYVVNPQFTDGGRFTEGMAPVQVGEKFGFIDRTGAIRINPQYDAASQFAGGLARVVMDGKTGYIDRIGRLVVAAQYDAGGDFAEGQGPVASGGKWGFVNAAGQLSVPLQFDGAAAFSDGLALVRVGERWGYVDHAGHFAVNPQFDEAGDFKEGRAAVRSRDRWGYIDRTGRLVTAAMYTEAQPFAEGMARVRTPRGYGYVAHDGSLAVQATFDAAAPAFHGGLAWVRTGSRIGYIDTSGRYRIAPAEVLGAGAPRTLDELLAERAGDGDEQDEGALGQAFMVAHRQRVQRYLPALLSAAAPGSHLLMGGSDTTLALRPGQVVRVAFTVPPGDRAVWVTSQSFDPVLTVYRVTPGGLVQIGHNDDSNGPNPMLQLGADRAQVWVAEITAYDPRFGGVFTLNSGEMGD